MENKTTKQLLQEIADLRRRIAELEAKEAERKQAKEALESKVKQLTALSRASQAVTTTLELDQVLTEIVSLASEVTASDYTSVVLMDEAGHIKRSTENIPGIPTIKHRIRKGGITDWILGSRRAVIVDEIGEDGAISPAPGEGAPRTANPHIIKAGINSFAALPLEVKGRLLGVLYLHSLRPGAFHDQLPLLTAFANQVAIAIENARLYEALEQELAERKRAEEALIHNLEDRLAAEEALRESEERFRRLAENASDLIYRYEFTPQRGFTYVNPAATAVTGYTPEEYYADPDLGLKIVHPDDRPLLEHYFQGGGVFRGPIVLRWIRKDGQIIWTEQRNVPVYDEAGNLTAIEGIARDITERKLLEQRLMTIHALGQKLVLLQKVEEIAQQVTDAALAVLRFPMCDLWLADEKSRVLTRICQSPAEPILALPSLSLDGERGIIAAVVRSGQTIYLPDVDQDPRYIRGSYPSRSELCVPLRVRKRTIGALNAESVHLDAFSPADIQLLEALANAAAVTLENARLHEERERQTAQLELINRIGQELATTLDLPTLARIAYQHISRLMDAPHMVISRYDPQTQLIHADFAIVDGEETDVSTFPPIPLEPDTGLQSKVIVSGQPLIVDDLQAQLRQVQTVHYVQERDLSKPQAALYAPLLAGERVIGTLNVQSYKLKAYSEEDARLLTTIASQLALAIENARLFQAEQKRAQQLAIINELGQALAATLDLPTVYRTAYKYVQRLVDCPNFAISLFDPEQQMMTMAFCLSDGVELDLALFPPLPYNPQARAGRSKAIASGQAEIIGDLPSVLRESSETYTVGNGEEPLSALYVPMLVEGQAIGLLELQSYQPHAYSQEDVDLLTTAANQIGLSIQNARLFKETHRLKEFNESIVQNMSEGIAIEDVEGCFTFVNPAAEAMLGYAPGELIGQHWTAIIPPDQHPIVRAANERRRRGVADSYELKLVRKDGTRLPVLISGSPRFENGRFVGTLAVFADISELKRLEAQFLQSQKMEAIGRLAGGVAHDFNNLLTAIIGYTDLLLREFPPYDPKREDLQDIRQAAERAATLTRQLLAFSRKQILEPRILNLNTTVSNLEKMLRRLIGEDIELVTHLAPDLDHVKADPGQIEQVIMNLAVNARDAMPQGGQLTIETKNVTLDKEYVRQHVEVQPGPYVMLAISDTGVGMDKETMSHLFEPFFTTKEVGKGTGLGLATVYGIVKQSGGHITVYSEPGLGTTFKVYLPRVEEESAAEEEPQLQVPAELLQGQETILVVEDEEVVRDLAVRVLRKQGYTVLQAQDGAEALRVCREHQGPIHLLITDVVMPGGMSGRQVAEQLQPLQPEMKVLYMSGYTENAIVHHGVLELGTVLLQKPFTPSSLAHKVRQILDENKPNGGTRNGS